MVSFESVIHSLDEALFLFDKKGMLVFINRAGEEFIGKSVKEIKKKHFSVLFPAASELQRFLQKALDEGRVFNCKDMELDIGRTVNIDLNISPYYEDAPDTGSSHKAAARRPAGEGHKGALLCMRENLSIAEREDYHFDSLLYLIGSIAHEVKNPLSGIKGAAQILRQSTQEAEAVECVDLIVKESDRLNAVLQTYLTMTRKPVLNPLNIHEAIEHALKIVAPSLKKVVIKRLYDPSLPHIMGDEGKLLQVFINLLKNAVEAMHAAPLRELQIATRLSNEYMMIQDPEKFFGVKSSREPLQEEMLSAGEPKKQRWIVVDIQDTGTGIAREELFRIFLPFYTKKAGGSGLGLALSKKIINDHRGIVRMQSKVGKGTTASVYLPLAAHKGPGRARGEQKA